MFSTNRSDPLGNTTSVADRVPRKTSGKAATQVVISSAGPRNPGYLFVKCASDSSGERIAYPLLSNPGASCQAPSFSQRQPEFCKRRRIDTSRRCCLETTFNLD